MKSKDSKKLKPMRSAAETEIAALRAEYKRGAGMALLLEELTRLEFGKTTIKRTLRAKLESWDKPLQNLTDIALGRAYDRFSKELRRYFSRTESSITPYERKFAPIVTGKQIGRAHV